MGSSKPALQIGVKVILFDPVSSMFLALKRESHQELEFLESFDVPGGRLEPGEEPMEGLMRELREEIGCIPSFDSIRILDAGNIVNTEEKQIVRITYGIKAAVNIESLRMSNEHAEATLLPLEESKGFHPLLNRAIREMKVHVEGAT